MNLPIYFHLSLVSLFFLQIWYFGGIIRSELIIGFIYFIILISRSDLNFRIKNLSLIKTTIIILFFALTSIIPLAINSTQDYSIILIHIKIIISFIASYCIINSIKPSNNDLILIIRIITIFCIVFYIFSIFNDNLKNLAISFKGTSYGLEEKLEVYRLWFPTSAHTFNLGIFFTLLLLYQLKIKEKLPFLLITIICATISARSAMIYCLISTSIILLSKIRFKGFLFIAIIFITSIHYLSKNYEKLNPQLSYAIEPIVIISGKKESSGSLDKLFDEHIFIPKTENYIFGDGKYRSSDGFYGGSDSGFIRTFYYGGFFYFAFTLLLLIYICVRIYGLNLLGFISALIIISAQFKSNIFDGAIQLWLMVFLYYYERISKNENWHYFTSKRSHTTKIF